MPLLLKEMPKQVLKERQTCLKHSHGVQNIVRYIHVQYNSTVFAEVFRDITTTRLTISVCT